jgi:hypothetical protein
VEIDPFEAPGLKVNLVKRWLASVKIIQGRTEILESPVDLVIEQPPADLALVVPF